jgi:hypothetical protein
VNVREIVLDMLLETCEKEVYSHLILSAILEKYQYIDTEIREVVVKQTMDMVDINNGLSSKEVADMMLEGVLRSHHYLQSEFWNTIIHLMKKYAESESKFFDPRNETSRKMCEEIVKNWLR